MAEIVACVLKIEHALRWRCLQQLRFLRVHQAAQLFLHPVAQSEGKACRVVVGYNGYDEGDTILETSKQSPTNCSQLPFLHEQSEVAHCLHPVLVQNLRVVWRRGQSIFLCVWFCVRLPAEDGIGHGCPDSLHWLVLVVWWSCCVSLWWLIVVVGKSTHIFVGGTTEATTIVPKNCSTLSSFSYLKSRGIAKHRVIVFDMVFFLVSG